MRYEQLIAPSFFTRRSCAEPLERRVRAHAFAFASAAGKFMNLVNALSRMRRDHRALCNFPQSRLIRARLTNKRVFYRSPD